MSCPPSQTKRDPQFLESSETLHDHHNACQRFNLSRGMRVAVPFRIVLSFSILTLLFLTMLISSVSSSHINSVFVYAIAVVLGAPY